MPVRRKRITILVSALAATVATLVFASAPASATTFTNSGPITVPTQGSASPSASPVEVSGLDGPISLMSLTLHGVTHTRPADLDVLVRAPDGRMSIVASDACGSVAVSNRTWVFTTSGTPGSLPQSEFCQTGLYRPTDYNTAPLDNWPDAPAGAVGQFIQFDGIDPNGTWNLYVVDDTAGESGTIGGGWSLDIDTVPPDVRIPGAGTSGPADPYPTTRTVSGIGGVITDVDVVVNSLSHHRPDDLDMLLVGPRGQKAMLMSDACGESDLTHRTWTFNDEATAQLADPGICTNAASYRPVDYEPGDGMPPGAPPGPYAASLSEFDLTDPNGDWRLFVSDDQPGETGWFADSNPVRGVPFNVILTTRPKAKVAFSQSAASLTEGQSADLVLNRTGATQLGAGSVTVTSTPGTATSGEDFKPVSTTVDFAPGQIERTVPVEALTDGAAEGEETFTVSIAQASGDADAATPSSATVTIRDPDPAPDADLETQPDAGGDTTAPETSIEKAPKRRTDRPTARFLFSASEDGSSFECQLDRGKFKPCASPSRLKRLATDKHSFSVRAIDAAGNVDPTPAKRRWKVVDGG